jgi:hypothetical protein
LMGTERFLCEPTFASDIPHKKQQAEGGSAIMRTIHRRDSACRHAARPSVKSLHFCEAPPAQRMSGHSCILILLLPTDWLAWSSCMRRPPHHLTIAHASQGSEGSTERRIYTCVPPSIYLGVLTAISSRSNLTCKQVPFPPTTQRCCHQAHGPPLCHVENEAEQISLLP